MRFMVHNGSKSDCKLFMWMRGSVYSFWEAGPTNFSEN